MSVRQDFTGEFIGTFILVFFGCGSVATTVLFSAHMGLFQVAMVWGLGVTLAIYATRHLSCAHLNPAVSLAMVVARRMSARRLPAYLSAQFAGAFVAAAVLYLLFSPSIAQFELLHGITRGSAESTTTAMMFGEFFPNPGAGAAAAVSMPLAFLAEAIGTFALVFLIFSLTEGCNLGRPDDALAPLFIGMSVTLIISILAPLTQAGLNPARDLSPRLFSMLAGWGTAALPDRSLGFLVVYVLGPIAGGCAAALVFSRLVEPLMNGKALPDCLCKDENR
ncbi:MIP/aquaporin family protein [Geoalkalibacter sp.]|uniref:MIP/aquaporin family protein n=1 Tax=Geoalkalibacter sp. TaxID=3041440 RepID=UPI00272EE5F3|nr:MIP/aquaporin family protein [Geoalkalibacter sp.]